MRARHVHLRGLAVCVCVCVASARCEPFRWGPFPLAGATDTTGPWGRFARFVGSIAEQRPLVPGADIARRR